MSKRIFDVLYLLFGHFIYLLSGFSETHMMYTSVFVCLLLVFLFVCLFACLPGCLSTS